MRKKALVFLCILLILSYEYFALFTDLFDDNDIIKYLMIGIMVLFILYIISLVNSSETKVNIRAKDKLFKSLMQNSDTVYVMMNSKTEKVIFLSSNVEQVLGISSKNKKDENVVFDIFNIPIIKTELKNWDKKQTYVSGMVEYSNPLYNHQMWIKIKIFNYKDKNSEYYIVEIIDATKEHERQHLLVSQASDIKNREVRLNQITAASYDMELDIDLITGKYELKYFKKDILYFGEEKKGNYNEFINEIVENYINSNDKEEVLKNISLENLKRHFNRYELDSTIFRYRIGNKVKDNIWLESTVFYLLNRQSNKVSILTKNVTENAESIREQNVLLQNALNEAKVASRAKTNMIRTISHDIRTPLTNIIGFSDSLLKNDLPKNISEDIKNINTSAVDIKGIIDVLLDPSKIEKETLEKNEKQYSVLKMFNKVEIQAKELLKNKDVKLNINLDSNLPVILYGDFKRITQAIINIINNSIKFTEEGEINVSVKGEKKDADVNLIIEISDTGIGMDPKKLESVIKSEDSTTGLGSVKSLIKLLDGKLVIESKEKEYTKVTMSFIQKIVEDNKVRELMNTNKKAEVFSLKGKNILVIDDNKLNLKVTSKLLEPYEVNVTVFESGEECIDTINEGNKYDLILMDIMMPGMDGIETLSKLKEINDFDIPVIALTADAIVGQKEKYLAMGFNDYLTKPIDKSELSRILKEILKES